MEMICPECKELGLKSNIQVQMGMKTSAGVDNFYDKDGKYHSHDRNQFSSTWRCSKKHGGKIVRVEGCSVENCEFKGYLKLSLDPPQEIDYKIIETKNPERIYPISSTNDSILLGSILESSKSDDNQILIGRGSTPVVSIETINENPEGKFKREDEEKLNSIKVAYKTYYSHEEVEKREYAIKNAEVIKLQKEFDEIYLVILHAAANGCKEAVINFWSNYEMMQSILNNQSYHEKRFGDIGITLKFEDENLLCRKFYATGWSP